MGKKTILNVTETPVTNEFVGANGEKVSHYKFPNGLEVQIVSDGKNKFVTGNYELKQTETESELIITPDMSQKDDSFKPFFN
ncbi:hypothetical protein [Staphylococcus nepalensis]|uniref:hypothetical protein n=1 Tax=Staphylococcus nepalensis TaxID=214473 RepID=UPI0031BB8219